MTTPDQTVTPMSGPLPGPQIGPRRPTWNTLPPAPNSPVTPGIIIYNEPYHFNTEPSINTGNATL